MKIHHVVLFLIVAAGAAILHSCRTTPPADPEPAPQMPPPQPQATAPKETKPMQTKMPVIPHWTERNVVFPADAGVINVKAAPYNAKGDGVTDDTAAIQMALTQFPSGNKIIYLPAGTYLISNTLKWGGTKNANNQKRTILQGQGAKLTTLRLKDNCPGFTNGGRVAGKYKKPDGKAMIWTGKAPAQRFRNGIRDITLDVGQGNPGAIAARFIGNNQACIRNVVFRSTDKGRIGLDLGYSDEQGPVLVKNVRVEGFDIGIYAWGAVDSITMYNIEVKGQRELGMLSDHQVVSIENFRSRNDGTAINNLHGDGVITLIGADLQTSGTAVQAPAILNKGGLYVRNLTTKGYAKAIRNLAGTKRDAPGPTVKEFTSHKPITQFNDKPTALHLEIKPTPDVPEDPLDQWISPLQFGGNPRDKGDDTAAIQKAIDAGKTTVYLPNGVWRISGELFVRGKVRRIIGCEAMLKGNAVVRLVDGTAPVVKIERIEVNYTSTKFSHESKRTLVLSSCRLWRKVCYEGTGGGDLFVEDVCGDPWIFNNQKAWLRQVNPESSHHNKMEMKNSTVWMLGLKTEGDRPALVAENSAVEICGAFIYANTRTEKHPLFIVRDTDFSVTMGESSFRSKPHRKLVVETRGATTKTQGRDGVPNRGAGRMFPLYVGRGRP